MRFDREKKEKIKWNNLTEEEAIGATMKGGFETEMTTTPISYFGKEAFENDSALLSARQFLRRNFNLRR